MELIPNFTTPRVGPEVHAYQIQDFFSMRGVQFGRGIVTHQPDDLPRVLLRLWNGKFLSVSQASDPFHESHGTRTAFHFSATIPAGATVQQCESIQLYLFFKHDHIIVDTPGAQMLANNEFLTTEKIFWDALEHAADGARAIEIGSRARSGISRRERFPPPYSTRDSTSWMAPM